MATNRINLQPGYILHQRAYRDTSLILEVLTPDYGRISILAKGAKSPRLRASKPILLPFTSLALSWVGKRDLVTLVAAEPTAAPVFLQGKALLTAMYVNELLMKVLVKGEGDASLFALYQQVIANIVAGTEIEANLRLFEKALLHCLGYSLNITQDSTTQAAIEAEQLYHFHPETGVVAVVPQQQRQGFFGAEHSLFPGKVLLAIEANLFNEPEVLRAAKRLMRLAFAPLLGSKRIATKELFIT